VVVEGKQNLRPGSRVRVERPPTGTGSGPGSASIPGPVASARRDPA